MFKIMNTYLQVLVFPSRTLSMAAEVVLKQYKMQQYSVIIIYILCSDQSDFFRREQVTVSETFTNLLPIDSVTLSLYSSYKHNIVCAYNIFGKLNAKRICVYNTSLQQPLFTDDRKM